VSEEKTREELLTEQLEFLFGSNLDGIESVGDLAQALIIIDGLTEEDIAKSLPKKSNGDRPSGNDVVTPARGGRDKVTVNDLVEKLQSTSILTARVIGKFVGNQLD